VKAGWAIKPLKSFCDNFKQDIVDGPFGSELQRKDYISEGSPVLKIQNIKPFAIELKRMDYVSPAKFDELKRHSYRRGDIVMTKLGSPLGVSAIVEGVDDGLIVADLVRIRAKGMNTKYLCYHLNSQRTSDFINSMQKGTTRPRVTLSVVRELPIAVPSPEEQRRLVAILDQAFAAIAIAKANAEKNLQNARALFESHLQEVFTQRGEGWVEKPLESVASITNGYSFKSSDFSNTEGVKCIKITNVGVREFVCYSDSFLPLGFSAKYGGVSVRKGSIVIALTRTIISGGLKVAVVPEEYDRALLNQRVASILPNPKILTASFLFSYLSTMAVINYVKERVNTLMQPNLSIKDLNSMPVPMPPVHEQNRISNELSTLRKETQRLESIYQEKFAALEELKNSLLHEAFSGQL
jgi:type I restriction enzyme, S subunit